MYPFWGLVTPRDLDTTGRGGGGVAPGGYEIAWGQPVIFHSHQMLI